VTINLEKPALIRDTPRKQGRAITAERIPRARTLGSQLVDRISIDIYIGGFIFKEPSQKSVRSCGARLALRARVLFLTLPRGKNRQPLCPRRVDRLDQPAAFQHILRHRIMRGSSPQLPRTITVPLQKLPGRHAPITPKRHVKRATRHLVLGH